MIGGIPVTVRRGDVRRLRITIRPPHGEVRVSAPRRISEAEVVGFVTSRLDWIVRHRAALTITPDDGVRIWGRLVPLLVTTAPGRPHVTLTDEGLHVHAPDASAADAAIARWRRDQLAAALPPLLATWQAALGVRHSSVTLRTMTSRWGSCNRRTGRITFNIELVGKPPECLEYVVVHELAHLIAANHGPEFQAIMNRHLPGWRARRRTLNGR